MQRVGGTMSGMIISPVAVFPQVVHASLLDSIWMTMISDDDYQALVEESAVAQELRSRWWTRAKLNSAECDGEMGWVSWKTVDGVCEVNFVPDSDTAHASLIAAIQQEREAQRPRRALPIP